MSTSSAPIVENFAKNRSTRDWIYGFFLLGILVGCIGTLLIAWQYHIDTNPQLIGLHFLALNAGHVTALAISKRILRRFSIRSVAVSCCLVGFLSLLSLCFLAPPVPVVWRILGLGFSGLAGGGLATSLLHILEPYFSHLTATAVNAAGGLFGFGCTVATTVVALIYFAGSVQMETAVLSAFPLLFAFLFATSPLPSGREPFRFRGEPERRRHAVKGVRSAAGILFSLLIFFQSGNEWVLAGWLPLFLIHRLSANPVIAMLALAAHFLALTVSRLAVRSLMPRINHRRLLLLSIVAAVTGYSLLSSTSSLTSAFIAAVVIGISFAPIYPLLAETLDDRFSYHIGFYNGVFSIAFTGAMSAPWVIGYIYAFFGTRYIMLVPAFGSMAVLVLALLIMLETHLMGSKNENSKPLVRTAAAGKE